MRSIIPATLLAVLLTGWSPAPAAAPLAHSWVDDKATLYINPHKGVHGLSGKTPATAKKLAKMLALSRGWSHGRQWRCLVELWTHESGWRYNADNPTSPAQGIPQIWGLDPDMKPSMQIHRGLKYISHRYGSPCNAWNRWKARGYHDEDGWHGGWY